MKNLPLGMLILLPQFSYSQYNQYEVKPKSIIQKPYDSSFNFSSITNNETAHTLIGQELYFTKENSKTIPKIFSGITSSELSSNPMVIINPEMNGYGGLDEKQFFLPGGTVDWAAYERTKKYMLATGEEKKRFGTTNVYKPILNTNLTSDGEIVTPYSAFSDKEFTVINFGKNPEDTTRTAYTLKDAEGRLVYLPFDHRNLNSPYQMSHRNIHIKGFTEHIKSTYIGQTVYFKLTNNPTDLNTLNGDAYTLIPGSPYKIIALGFILNTLVIDLRDSLTNEILIPVSNTPNPVSSKVNLSSFWTQIEFVDYIQKVKAELNAQLTNYKKELAALSKKYGAKYASDIMDGVVSLGMSREMCRLTWGYPYNITESLILGNKIEIWYYSLSQWVEFKNGKVVTVTQ